MNLSKYIDLYRHFAELDGDVLWQKVAVIRDALAEGANAEALLAELGKESGDSKRQMRKFYAVARVFKESDVYKDFDYWTHEVAATAGGVEPEDPQTYHIADTWMRTAAHGYETTRTYKSGRTKTTTRKHTARTLRRLMAGKREPKETVYRGEATLARWKAEPKYATLTFVVPLSELNLDIHAGDDFTVTITRKQAPVADVTTESEAAA